MTIQYLVLDIFDISTNNLCQSYERKESIGGKLVYSNTITNESFPYKIDSMLHGLSGQHDTPVNAKVNRNSRT